MQAHAAAAVVNFSEGAEADLMAPHLDTLITKLLTLLQRGKKLVQVGAGFGRVWERPCHSGFLTAADGRMRRCCSTARGGFLTVCCLYSGEQRAQLQSTTIQTVAGPLMGTLISSLAPLKCSSSHSYRRAR